MLVKRLVVGSQSLQIVLRGGGGGGGGEGKVCANNACK